MLVVAVGKRYDGWHSGIRIPNDALRIHSGIKAEHGVLLMQTMIITARQKRANEEPHTLVLVEQTPANLREL